MTRAALLLATAARLQEGHGGRGQGASCGGQSRGARASPVSVPLPGTDAGTCHVTAAFPRSPAPPCPARWGRPVISRCPRLRRSPCPRVGADLPPSPDLLLGPRRWPRLVRRNPLRRPPGAPGPSRCRVCGSPGPASDGSAGTACWARAPGGQHGPEPRDGRRGQAGRELPSSWPSEVWPCPFTGRKSSLCQNEHEPRVPRAAPGTQALLLGAVRLLGCLSPPHQVTPDTSREKPRLVRKPVRLWAGVTEGGDVGFTPSKPVTPELPGALAAPHPRGADQGSPGLQRQMDPRGSTGSHGTTPELE